jgi:ComF family protein
VLAPHLARHLEPLLQGIPGSLLLIPVPLHPRRLRKRGHNQAELLASALTRASQQSISQELVRTRATVSQTTLDRAERLVNVHDAFAWKGGSLHGKTVVLIDDVTTTGATFSACAAALQPAGPAAVWGLAVAKKR